MHTYICNEKDKCYEGSMEVLTKTRQVTTKLALLATLTRLILIGITYFVCYGKTIHAKVFLASTMWVKLRYNS